MTSSSRITRAVTVLAALALLVAACGGDDDAPDTAGDSGGESESPEVDLSDEVITLGLTTSLTGEAAGAGRSIANATEMVIEEVNAAGGIHGATLQLIVEDTQFDPDQEIAAMQKLIDQEGVDIMVGPVTGRSVNAGAPVALDAGIITVVAHASEGGLEELGEELLYVSATEPFLAEKTATHLVEEFAPKSAVLAWDDGEPFAKRSADTYRAVFEDAGVEIVDEIAFDDEAGDFSNVATAVSDADPDVVMIGAFPEIQASVTLEVRERGYDGPIGCASNGCNGVDYSNVAGPAAVNSFSTLGFNPASEAATAVREQYEAAYPDDPFTPFVLNQYDGLQILVEILRQVDPAELLQDGSVNTDAVLDVVAGGDITIEGARGTQTLTADRTVEFENTATYEFVLEGDKIVNRFVDE